MKKTIRRLPDSELAVMQAVWQCTPPVSRTDLEEMLLPQYPMAQTTLLTLLTRLAEKGFLAVEKQGRSNVYMPLISRDAYLADQSRRFVDQLCGGSISETKSFDILSSIEEPACRRLIIIDKVKKTAPLYPRHYSKISKKPL